MVVLVHYRTGGAQLTTGRDQSYLRCAQPVRPWRAEASERSEGDGGILRLLLVVNMLLIQHLVLLGLLVVVVVEAADLVIRIPGDLSQQDGFYRLDYRCTGWAGSGGGEGSFACCAVEQVVLFPAVHFQALPQFVFHLELKAAMVTLV